MKNILKKAENAEKLLNLTSDTMILLDRNGVCVDIAVHDINLWFLTEDQLLDKNILQPAATLHLPENLPGVQESASARRSLQPEL